MRSRRDNATALRLLGSKFDLTYAGVFSGPHLLLRGMGEWEAKARIVRGKVMRRMRSLLPH